MGLKCATWPLPFSWSVTALFVVFTPKSRTTHVTRKNIELGFVFELRGASRVAFMTENQYPSICSFWLVEIESVLKLDWIFSVYKHGNPAWGPGKVSPWTKGEIYSLHYRITGDGQR